MTAAQSSSIDLRLEQAGDAAAVRAVLESAFAGTAEADLVDRLRANEELVLALAAERADRRIAGYVAFARLSVETRSAHADRRDARGVGLAPLAVAPEFQRRGIGAALVRRGLAVLTGRGEQLVFVLGDPAYYLRFGFGTAAAASFVSPYAGPHFMVHRLTPTAPVEGTVRYPPAFADLG